MDELCTYTDSMDKNSLKYPKTEQTEKMWMRLKGMQKYKNTSQRFSLTLKGTRYILDASQNRKMAQFTHLSREHQENILGHPYCL
nr:calcium/calmodulin-dependent 3',5'-cyclic nucleotide phosphodiesterase 1C-like [Oncorhynchus nerka]